MNAPVSLALIGCGGMGQSLAKNLPPDLGRVVLCCDTNAETSRTVAESLDARAVTELDAVLEDASVDGAIVATPPFLHAPQTIQLLGAGKHVFCEKPMALQVEECDRMIEAGEQADRALMIGQVLRLYPVHKYLLDACRSATWGKPLAVIIRRSGTSFRAADHWRANAEQSGGWLFEVMIHEVDYAATLMGTAKAVFAQGLRGRIDRPPTGMEDLIHVSIVFEGDRYGHLEGGSGDPQGGYSIRVHCEKATLVVPSPFSREAGVEVYPFEGERHQISEGEIPQSVPVHDELEMFLNAVLHGTDLSITPGQSRHAVAIARAAYESEERGELIPIR